MARLLAAMSGGVDSSVAAALAVRAGHDVVGVTLKQWEHPGEEFRLAKGCCTLDAVADARRAADVCGIPHYTLDFRDVFAREVVGPFVADYAAGRTPNPCVRCNEVVRFGALLDRAERLGFDGLVTGHWARAVPGPRLLRARNAAKDQSYVLYALGPRALARAHFPLGDFESKAEVRALARELGMPNWDREDSLEVCFVPEGARPADLVAAASPGAVRRGPVLDRDGRVVGEHAGLPHYTIGQRRGLGAFGSRTYVTAIDAARNALVVGGRDDLIVRTVVASRPRFVRGLPPDGARVAAALRYRGRELGAVVHRDADGFRLNLEEPAAAAAPGQAAVLYDGDEVLGGGTILRAS